MEGNFVVRYSIQPCLKGNLAPLETPKILQSLEKNFGGNVLGNTHACGPPQHVPENIMVIAIEQYTERVRILLRFRDQFSLRFKVVVLRHEYINNNAFGAEWLQAL